MKKILLLPLFFLFLFSACKKEEPTLFTTMDLEVRKQNKSSSGKITTEPISAIIHVWNAEGRDFDINASPDIHFGSAYDKSSESFQTMKYGAIGSKMKEKIKPGKYFIYVLLPKSANNTSLVYSYSYFEIKEGETLKLNKTFSHNVSAGMYEVWEKNL